MRGDNCLFVCCSSCAVRCWLFVVCWLLSVVDGLMFVDRCVFLLVARCLLFVVLYSLLPVV